MKKGHGEWLGQCGDGRAIPEFSCVKHTGDDSLRDIASLWPWRSCAQLCEVSFKAFTLILSCLLIKIRVRPGGTEGGDHRECKAPGG